MPQYVYLDTNAFRHFGEAFGTELLPDDLREKMLISPLSAFEVLAQLAREDCGDEVLRQIKAIRNWTNPIRSGLLPWPNVWLYEIWFQKNKPDDGFSKKMANAFNRCLAADSPASLETLKKASAEHAKLMDGYKRQKAEQFKVMIDAARQEKIKAFDSTEFWFASLAESVGADPKSKPIAEVVCALSAHHEFEQSKLRTALEIPDYNPLSRKNQNDVIDVDQLLYLADETLCMLTADGGFKKKVTKSRQAARIITAPEADLMDARKAETMLRNIVSN